MEWQRFLRQFGKAVGSLLWDFRATLLVMSLVLGLSLASQAALGSGVASRDQLAASRANPLGVVTSVFAHWDTTRLEMNAEGLLFFTGAYLFASIPQSRAERVRRGMWFALLVIPIAVTVNVAYISISTGLTLGASGLVYAGFGIGFAFLLLNIKDDANGLVRLVRGNRNDPKERHTMMPPIWWRGVNFLLFLISFYLLIFDTALMFGAGEPGINAFAHLWGFLLGFVFTYVRNFLPQPIPFRIA